MSLSSAPGNAPSSPTAVSPELRAVDADGFDAWYDVLLDAFGGVPESPEERALWRELTEPGRSIGAFDANSVVGTASAFTFGLAVPGGAGEHRTSARALVPAAGVTMVGVRGTHRRRGLLTAMMRRQLDDVRERGEPLAVLTASEPSIYGRFGYGVGTSKMWLEMDRHRVRITERPFDATGAGGTAEAAETTGTAGVRLRLVDPTESLARCEELYTHVGRQRPGWLRRPDGWERVAVLDPRLERSGNSPLFCLLAEHADSGELLGYARYTVKPDWERQGPKGTVNVRELYAATPGATVALWQHLLDVDLTDRVVVRSRPLDDPILNLVDDVRRCNATIGDGLHIRLVDVGAALAARAYSRPVDAVVEVHDAFCGWNTGRWRLSGDESGASCERTTDPADVSLTVRELAASYLGGTTLRALAEAGRVAELRENAGALGALSAAFATDVAPWLPRGF
ncbi:GNAT family N-acetyltransferase [Streptacidiphilus fuscans]|uniref:GNAT family N-acetyltransferase n=1 Tax=Streptacidiphilus fuscans TaxID=2789292 RepID=A0A931FFK9_9ACTN|nr:GNAT family N-acetyltransferase [Streptacidiphilus fuscans]MBF9070385.1 GNAT family N-acetyltransferase [Streptacidiphilus fuscans]